MIESRPTTNLLSEQANQDYLPSSLEGWQSLNKSQAGRALTPLPRECHQSRNVVLLIDHTVHGMVGELGLGSFFRRVPDRTLSQSQPQEPVA